MTTIDEAESLSSFCDGRMPMTMYMDGFRWSLFWRRSSLTTHEEFENASFENGKNNINPCLTYFVPTWLLSTSGQFVGAMIFSFLLALFMEILSALREIALHHWLPPPKQRQHQQPPHNGQQYQQALPRRDWLQEEIPNDLNNDNRTNRFIAQQKMKKAAIWKQIILCLIYLLQTTLGYLLMFMAMSFSIEIILSAVAGLMVGNLLFFRYTRPPAKTRRHDNNHSGSSINATNQNMNQQQDNTAASQQQVQSFIARDVSTIIENENDMQEQRQIATTVTKASSTGTVENRNDGLREPLLPAKANTPSTEAFM